LKDVDLTKTTVGELMERCREGESERHPSGDRELVLLVGLYWHTQARNAEGSERGRELTHSTEDGTWVQAVPNITTR